MSAATRARQAANYAMDVDLFPDFPGRPRVPKGDRLPPCDCGDPADKPMYGGGICDGCFDEIVERVAARQALRGWGRRVEPSTTDPETRSRFPAGYRDLRCVSCSATWFGPPGEPCSWCVEALERMRHDQAEILLRPDLPDVDDARYAAGVMAWGERLARGIDAELIGKQTALAAWRKVVSDDFRAA